MEKDRLPFTLHTHTGSPTGYSETAAVLLRSLWDEGLEVHYLCVGDDPYYEQSSMDGFVDGMRSIEPEEGLPHIVYSTAPIFWHNGGKYKIGWTMMEVDGISDQWVRACNSQNEIWVPTAMQKKNFEESGVTAPIYIVPLCIDVTRYHPNITAAAYHGEAKFRFFSMGWWQDRKRWDLLLEIFEKRFGGNKDVALVIKTMSQEADEAIVQKAWAHVSQANRDQVAIINGPMPWWELVMVMRSCHAFALPTAGEGWGCPPVQALACGMPVIVTDCQGPGEVLRMGDGEPFSGVKLVPSEKALTPVRHPYYRDKNWWEVDVELFGDAMVEVYENWADWKAAAMCGSSQVRELRSGAVSARCVREQLARIYEGGF